MIFIIIIKVAIVTMTKTGSVKSISFHLLNNTSNNNTHNSNNINNKVTIGFTYEFLSRLLRLPQHIPFPLPLLSPSVHMCKREREIPITVNNVRRRRRR